MKNLITILCLCSFLFSWDKPFSKYVIDSQKKDSTQKTNKIEEVNKVDKKEVQKKNKQEIKIQYRQEIVSRYDNGNKKLVVKYQGEGIDEKIVERITFSETDQILRMEKPLENLIESYSYDNNILYEKIIFNNGQVYTEECTYRNNLLNRKFIFDNNQLIEVQDYHYFEKDSVQNYVVNHFKIDDKPFKIIKDYREINGEYQNTIDSLYLKILFKQKIFEFGNLIGEYDVEDSKFKLIRFKDNIDEEGITGKVSWFYYDGNLKSSEEYVKGKRNGEYISYHKNGNINYKLNYIDDKPIYEDAHLQYHDNGQISSESYLDTLIQVINRDKDYNKWDDYDYSDFKFNNYRLYHEYDRLIPIGKETFYYDNGQISSDYTIIGFETIYYSDSTTFYNYPIYQDGKRFRYFESGQLKGEITQNNDDEFRYEYFESGQLKSKSITINGNKTFSENWYDEDTQIEWMEYKDGEPFNGFEVYDWDYQKFLDEKYDTYYCNVYIVGKRQYSFYIGEEEYLMHGVDKNIFSTEFYLEMEKLFKSIGYKYIKKLQDGEFIEYYSNGNTKVKGKYENGNPIDFWSYYNQDGSLWRTETYYSDDEYIQSKVSSNQIGEIHTITEYENGKKIKWSKYHERKLVLESYYNNDELIKENWYQDGEILKTIEY